MNQPEPDFAVMEKVLYNEEPSRIPFYEHLVDVEIMEEIMDFRIPSFQEEGEGYCKRLIEFYYELGYDYVPFELRPRFPATSHVRGKDTALYGRGERSWADEHGGSIETLEDLEAAHWPPVEEAFDYAGFEKVGELLPPGMKVIGGASGGPFEHASFIMGLEKLSLAVYRQPELVEELFRKIGERLVGIAEKLARMDFVGAYRFGDDLGYKSGTMFSPELLKKHVFPWYEKIVQATHEAGKPFLLHSCGNLEEVMGEIIETGIDAKHSFEDVITPVDEAKRRWGEDIAILGGVDVDFICQRTPQEVKEYTFRILEECAPGGGYALGTGNSVPNYMPVDNYLAMLEAGREFK